jgi:PAS domain S-box-containing protein
LIVVDSKQPASQRSNEARAATGLAGRFRNACIGCGPQTWFTALRGDRFAIAIVFFVMAILIGRWVVFESQLTRERANKINDVMRENSNLARAFEEHTIRTLGYVDEFVIAIQKQYEAKGRNFDLQTFYREMRPNLEILHNVVITDEKGMIILGTGLSPRISLADREHVKVHSGAPTNFLYISKPMLARVNKQWSIIVTRRASKPDGSFAGVVGVAINPEYFSNFYRDVELGSQGVVSLIGTDGIVRARLSSNDAQLGRDLQQSKIFHDTSAVPKSSYVARSALDGIERIYSSRQVHGYPLVVYVGTSVAEALAQVVAQERDSRFTLAVASAIIVLFAIVLLLLNRRRTGTQTLLRESEGRFRSLMELSSDWYWEQDENYCFIDHKVAVTPDVEFREAPAVFGKTRWELHSRSLTPIQWAEHRRQLEARLEFRDLEFERPSRDGKLRWVSVSGMPIFGEDGTFRGYRGTGKDISERKKAESEQAKLAAIVENSNDAIYSRTLDGTILSWNAGAERMLGYTAAEMIGNSTEVTRPPNQPSRLLKVNADLLLGGLVVNELVRKTKDGRIITVRSSHSPLSDSNNNVIGVSSILQDITERKKAEIVLSQFKAIVDTSEDAIISKTMDGIIRSWNPGAEKLFGFTAKEAIGNSMQLIIPTDRLNEESEILAQLSKGKKVEHFETVRRHKGGHLIDISATISPIMNEDGGVTGASKIARDITARKQSETVRASLEAQLRESQKMEAIGTLAGGIAHDFNNIVATILGNAELAFEDANTNPRATQESIEEIRKAGRRARDLVAQILSFSRRQPTERKTIELVPVINESARLLRATIPPRISIAVHCESHAPAVLADAGQIQQIVMNLATNAMHAIPGNGRINFRLDTVLLDAALVNTHTQLRALHDRHPGRTIRLAVSDTGSGMDSGTVDKIFEPFFTTKPVGEGTGLGLSVAYGIVQTHEGAITVESAPGKGTTFTIYLPIAEATSAVPAVEAGAAPTGSRQGTNLHVLYLDDDEALVYLVKRLLERRCYRVSDFTDQSAALAAFRANPATFDLVLSDYNMPGMSGLDVAREVRAIRADVPVAVTSGFIDEKLKSQAKDAGVRELIFKADGVDVLCDAVQQVIEEMAPKSS